MAEQSGYTQLLSKPSLSARDTMKWMELGACQNKDDDAKIFFPEQGNNAIRAKRMCQGCPVRLECLNWSIETRQMYGVWGGVAEKKRRKMMMLRHGRSPYYAVLEEENEDLSIGLAFRRS